LNTLTTSTVTYKEIGIRLLYKMRKVIHAHPAWEAAVVPAQSKYHVVDIWSPYTCILTKKRHIKVFM
jgi:hypothetical protein